MSKLVEIKKNWHPCFNQNGAGRLADMLRLCPKFDKRSGKGNQKYFLKIKKLKNKFKNFILDRY